LAVAIDCCAATGGWVGAAAAMTIEAG